MSGKEAAKSADGYRSAGDGINPSHYWTISPALEDIFWSHQPTDDSEDPSRNLFEDPSRNLFSGDESFEVINSAFQECLKYFINICFM